MRRTLALYACFAFPLIAQTAKEIRAMGKDGPNAIPRLQPLLREANNSLRLEAVKSIVEISSAASIDPLIEATRDNDPEIQTRATDGLVNFYLPGYVRGGAGASVKRAGNSIKSRFTDTNDEVIESFVVVRPEVIQALGKVATGGSSMESRAHAARAIGILRGRAAVPDLLDALRSKDSGVIYETLVALEKIRDESAGPKITYLLRDLDEKVQLAAIETSGLLNDRAALPELRNLLKSPRNPKVKRAALTAIAEMPDPANREIYAAYLGDRDERLRAAAAEGYARLRTREDAPLLEKAFDDESRNSTRISIAFALVMCGRADVSDFSPLRYLINNLNSALYRGEAFPFLIEAARLPEVRTELYGPLERGTRDEKIQLAKVLAESGDGNSVAHLEKTSRDTDGQVSAEGLRALRNLQARLAKTTSS